MSWLKSSDSSAMNPIVVAPMTEPGTDGLDPFDRVNLLFGFVMRCATWSAGYTTDYFVPDGNVMAAGGPNWQLRAEQAQRAGYWSRAAHNDGRPGWLLVKDSEHLFHIRLKAEIEWEKERKRDTNNYKLTVPVRRRDGDGCRYCGDVVQWGGKSNRAGTYDHRPPGMKAKSPENLVVSCFRCNRIRDNDPNADEHRPLMPVPVDPFYGPETVEYVKKHGGVTLTPSPEPPARPATQAVPAHPRRDPAASGVPRVPRVPVSQADPAPVAATKGATDPASTGAPAITKRPRTAGGAASPRDPANQADPALLRDPTSGGVPRASPQPAGHLPAGRYPPASRVGTGRDGTGVPASTGSRTRGRRSGRRARSPDPAQSPTQHRGDIHD